MKSRRGLATVFAVVLVAVVAVMLSALAAAFTADVKRSVRQADDAQLRQMLLAGQVAARHSLPPSGELAPGDHAVKLPTELQDAGWALSYARDEKDAGRIRVTARNGGGGRSLVQTIVFVRVGDRWELRSAEL